MGREEREDRSGMVDGELMEGQRAFSADAPTNPSDRWFNRPNFEGEETEALRCEVTFCPQETHKAQVDN